QGEVWLTNEPLVWGANNLNKSFLRNQAAKKADIKTVMGIPILHQTEQVGDLLVGSTLPKKRIKRHKKSLIELCNYIGTEIKWKRRENDMYNMFDTLPDMICLLD